MSKATPELGSCSTTIRNAASCRWLPAESFPWPVAAAAGSHAPVAAAGLPYSNRNFASNTDPVYCPAAARDWIQGTPPDTRRNSPIARNPTEPAAAVLKVIEFVLKNFESMRTGILAFRRAGCGTCDLIARKPEFLLRRYRFVEEVTRRRRKI